MPDYTAIAAKIQGDLHHCNKDLEDELKDPKLTSRNLRLKHSRDTSRAYSVQSRANCSKLNHSLWSYQDYSQTKQR